MNAPASKTEAEQALLKLKGFIGPAQLAAVKEAMRGEERQFFFGKMVELAGIIEAMPTLGEQEAKNEKLVVYLHYFVGGEANFYILEKDKKCAGDKPEQFQSQTFGITELFVGEGEFGYISIPEILSCGGELDFYFKPCLLSQVRAKK